MAQIGYGPTQNMDLGPVYMGVRILYNIENGLL